AIWAGETIRSVWPSGAAFTTASVAMLPVAPTRFSTTKGSPKALRHPLTNQACNGVSPGARRKPVDDAHRTRWIGLRPRDARHYRQRGSASGQMQEFAAGKFQIRHLRALGSALAVRERPNRNDEG